MLEGGVAEGVDVPAPAALRLGGIGVVVMVR